MKMTDKQIIDWVISCRNEADEAKRERMLRNRDNYDMFHLRYDFSHKKQGQSTDVLSKQPMAVEQIKSFFQQALADLDEWWKADALFADAEEGMLIKPAEITKLTNYMLMKARYFTHVGNTIQSALLGSLAISKTYGRVVSKPKFVSMKKGRGKDLKRWVDKVDDKTWELCFDVVRQENFYPDPTGKCLYDIEDMWLDMHEVIALSEGDDAIYDSAMVKGLSLGGTTDILENAGKARETGQNTTSSGHRPKVKLTEFWGTVINPTTGEVEMENCVITIANDTDILRKDPNPLWHQRRPYNYSPLMEVANSVWHKAPMDAPTQHAKSQIEIYNLLVDAAMKQVHAVSQIRSDALKDPAQVIGGIEAGTALDVNMTLPAGAKVMESLTTVIIPPEALNIFNIMAQEFNASALTNDLRQGVMPFRAVKATEVVEASQTITSVFQGMAKNYEARQSMPELELAWMTTAQNWSSISKEEFVALFGQQRGEEMSQMSSEDVFASTVNGIKFKVYGITLTLSKAADFRKWTTLMQTLAANPMMMEEFLKKYSLGKFLGELMSTLDVDKSKLEIPAAEQATMQDPQQQGQGAPQQPGADMNSQVPQAGAGSLSDMFAGGMPASNFPGSPASGAQ
jgi:hypothetical protein